MKNLFERTAFWVGSALILIGAVAVIGQQGPVTVNTSSSTPVLLYPTAEQLRTAAELTPLTAVGTASSYGTVSLVSGTAEIATSRALTGSHFQISHGFIGTSTAIGVLSVGTINNAVSFTIISRKSDGSIEDGDTSEAAWVLIAQ